MHIRRKIDYVDVDECRGAAGLAEYACVGRRSGFSLVELLVVISIVAILAAVVSPLVPSLMRANQLDSSVNTLSGILEQARERALSANTPVWIAFTDAPVNSPVGTWVATFQSADGTETPINIAVTPSWAATGVTVPGSNLALVSKIQNLAGVKIVDATSTLLPASLISTASALSSPITLFEPAGMQWSVSTLQSTGMGTGVYFTHALEFYQDGEARVQGTAGTWYNNIQFGLIPVVGTSTKNAALFNVTRLTGKTTVYRP